MEDLIQKIIDIESQAQEIILDAKKADNELPERVKDDTEKMHKDIIKKAAAKNAVLRQTESEDAKTRIGFINAETAQKLGALDEKYERNRDKWVNDIVTNIIG